MVTVMMIVARSGILVALEQDLTGKAGSCMGSSELNLIANASKQFIRKQRVTFDEDVDNFKYHEEEMKYTKS